MKKNTMTRETVTNFIKQCPLVVMLLVSGLGLYVFSAYAVLFGDYQFHITMEHPLFSSILLKEYKSNSESAGMRKEPDIRNASGDASGDGVPVFQDSVTDASGDGVADISGDASEFVGKMPILTQYKKTKKRKVNSPYYDDPGKIALTTDYDYVTVDSSYYEDALFVGDSRIEGLHDYSGLDNATYYYKEGLTVYDMMSEKIAKVKGEKVTLAKALSRKRFNKIYIMIGINELGERTTKEYAKQYQKNLEQIRQLQPDAIIFIMGIMHVTTEYSKSSEVFNNVNINDKNVAVAGLANGIDTFYLDMNPSVADKSGGVRKKYTWDGIHLKAEYYRLWVEFLNAHGLSEECFPAYTENGNP